MPPNRNGHEWALKRFESKDLHPLSDGKLRLFETVRVAENQRAVVSRQQMDESRDGWSLTENRLIVTACISHKLPVLPRLAHPLGLWSNDVSMSALHKKPAGSSRKNPINC